MAEPTPNQRVAVEHSGTPLFIQAGAGTGKTYTLTKRLAYGLSEESGPLLPGVDSVLTITFTNKAAAELLGRVRAELRARGLADAALDIDAAWISTIHSMCRAVLSSRALEAGIDPGTELLTEEESEALLKQAVDSLLGSQPMQQLVAYMGPGAACALVSQLAGAVALAPAGAAGLSLGPAVTEDPRTCARSLCVQLEDCLAALEELGVREAPSERCAVAVERLERHCAAARELAGREGLSWGDISRTVGAVQLPKGGSLKKVFREPFALCCDAISQALALAAVAQARQHLELALQLGQKAAQRHAALKAQRGAQDTDDLLAATYRLLEEHPDIASEYRERFGSVMVDEFQDTDNLQVGIISQLCGSDLSTLTTVGDKQQSIYRFRGADPAVYDEVKARMLGVGGTGVALDTNFRSHPDILSFVEAVFAHPLFWGDEFLFIKPGPANARSLSWVADDAPRVELLLSAGCKSEQGSAYTRSAELRAAEAEAIAARFEELAAAGAPYGSMALLMFSTKAAGPYLAAMRRRGIPCVVCGGSDFYTQPEVLLMKDLLRVLELPDDDKPLLELLASPLFDLPDSELLELRLIVRRELRNPAVDDVRPRVSLWDALELQALRTPDDESPLLTAYLLLSRALGQVGRKPLHQIAWQLLEDSGWLEELRRGGAQGLATAANLQRMCDLVAQFEEREGPAAVKVGEHFEDMCAAAADGGAKGKPGRMVGKGQDAVQVMTIHASKGLEFPIVAVAQYQRSQHGASATSAEALTCAGNRYLLLPPKVGGKGEERVREVCEQEGARAESLAAARTALEFAGCGMLQAALEEEQEGERLLYVALTRARDLLILASCDKSCGSKGELSGGGIFKRVVEALFGGLPAGNGQYRLGTGCLVEWRMQLVPYSAPAPGEGDEGDEGAQVAPPPALRTHFAVAPHEHAPLRHSAQVPGRAICSYSSLAPEHDSGIGPHDAATPQGEALGTVSPLGSAFHLVAQWLILQPRLESLRGSACLEGRIAAAAARYQLDAAAHRRLQAALESWLSSARFEGLRAWERLLPEQPFCVQGPRGMLEGSLDLLCSTPGCGSALVIDYKTGFSGSGEQLRERYALQAAVYAYALLAPGLYEQVELVFVRPEAGMEEVVFVYSRDEVDALAAVIAAA